MADEYWLDRGDSVSAGQVEKYLATGVSREWQEVRIPLENFPLLNLKDMGSFIINFNEGKSIIYIDDILFTSCNYH